MVVPNACTVKALYLTANNYYQTQVATITVTVYHGSNSGPASASATSMTASVSPEGNSASASDTTHTFSVAAGDILSLAYKNSNPATPYEAVTIQLVCQ
jgi:hypothetical protein